MDPQNRVAAAATRDYGKKDKNNNENDENLTIEKTIKFELRLPKLE